MKPEKFAMGVVGRIRILGALLFMILVVTSCTRVTAPQQVVQQGSFTFVLHLSSDSTVEGVAEFNQDNQGVPTFRITFVSSNPEFNMNLFLEGTRPDAGEYDVYNEPVAGAFAGTFSLGSELEAVEYELTAGRFGISNSSQNQISGSLEISAVQMTGENPGRQVNVSGIYRAPCFVNCPPSTGGPPS